MNSSGLGRRKRRLDQQKADSVKVFDCVRCTRTGTASYLSFNFKILVCDECRCDTEDKIITKTVMVKEYKISKWPMEDFLKEYPHMIKANPQHERGHPMVLIYEKHAKEFAVKLHGSLEVIEKRKQENADKRNAKLTIVLKPEEHLANLVALAGGGLESNQAGVGENAENSEIQKSCKKLDARLKNVDKNARAKIKRMENVCMEHTFGEPVKVENVKEDEITDSIDSDSSDYDMFEKTCESCGYVDRYEEF